MGSSPICRTKDLVAQLVEHSTFNAGVPGSRPGGITTLTLNSNKMNYYIGFDLAKKLHTNGIIVPTNDVYSTSIVGYYHPYSDYYDMALEGGIIQNYEACNINSDFKNNIIPAPTFDEIIHYLQDELGFFISVTRINDIGYRYYFTIYPPVNSTYQNIKSPMFDDYDECLLYAIREVIDVLTKK